MVTADDKVADIAVRSKALQAILHRYGLDLCCGGVHPLRMAAQAHGVDLEKVLAELNAAGRS